MEHINDRIYLVGSNQEDYIIAKPENCPKFSAYLSESIRVESFEKSNCPPFTTIYKKRQEFARAGFFFTHSSYGYEVTCFYCGLVLCNVFSQTNAWVEHCTYQPLCPFVRINKSSRFIKNCTTKLRPGLHTQEQINNYAILAKEAQNEAKEEENAKSIDTELNLCNACKLAVREYSFIPCSHLVCCKRCVTAFTECIICRQKIVGYQRINSA